MSSTAFSTTPTSDRPWVHEMVIIHRAFRRELTILPRLVREVRDGDTQRAATLAGAVRLVLSGLHHHHTGEDVVLWPALLERAAPSTGLVETMQAQHEAVEGHMEHVEPLLRAWESSPTTARGAELADLLDRLAGALVEHLDLEEREILPLAERHVTVAEWNSLGEQGVDEMDQKQLPIIFGAILEECTPEERRAMLAKLPLPVRLVLRTVGARQYRRYVTRVRGR
nr:hemerythrin domain-containing protein [uncultured Nocardioides sp.]